MHEKSLDAGDGVISPEELQAVLGLLGRPVTLDCALYLSTQVGMAGAPQEQKMLEEHLPRVIYNQVCEE